MNTRENTLHPQRILSPKTDVAYHISNPDLPWYVVSITFCGELVEKCVWYNTEVFSNALRNQSSSTTQVRGGDNHEPDEMPPIALSSESLSLYQTPTPPVLIHLPHGKLVFPQKMTVYLTADSNRTSINPDDCIPFDDISITSDNQRIKEVCTDKFGQRIQVQVGHYPIFSKHIRPTLQALTTIYQTFLAYNSEHDLQHQFNITRLFCHLRAHFVNELLRHYHIPSVKVFKAWKTKDWADTRFRSHDIWRFHAAAMIIDNDFNMWVFDPWTSSNRALLSLDSWLFRRNEPTPRKMLITSWTQTSYFASSSTAYGSNIMDHSNVFFKNLQAIFCNAIPNQPFLNRFGIFKQEPRKRNQSNEEIKLLPFSNNT